MKGEMKRRIKEAAKLFIPPIVMIGTRRVRLLFDNGALSRFTGGPYPTWEEAAAQSSDWDAPMILDKTLELSLKMRDGMIEFQQDCIVYPRIRYSETILAFIALALGMNGGDLGVVDYGGSLGTNFVQNRKVLHRLIAEGRCHWSVIETPAHVALGREHFENESLRFFGSLDELEILPRAFLFSGSLQCIGEAFSLLDRVVEGGANLIAFDRLLVSPKPQHEIFIHSYHETYPTWCFSRALFVETMASKGFALVEEFPFPAGGQYDPTTGPPGQFHYWCGLIFVRQAS